MKSWTRTVCITYDYPSKSGYNQLNVALFACVIAQVGIDRDEQSFKQAKLHSTNTNTSTFNQHIGIW